MLAPLLSLALSVSIFARVDTADAAKDVVRRALLAVEGDSIAPVRTRWSARLERDATDRAALLGIATLARLTYDYSTSDRLYPQLFGADSLHPDPYAAYARLGRAWSLEERGQSDAASDAFAQARRAARAAGDPAAEAEALIGLAFARGAAVPPHGRELARMSWLEFALNPLPDLFAAPPGGVSVKVKDALLKKRFTDRQIGVAYDYLTRTDHDVMGGMLGLATYGGRINTVAPDATASAQRDAILDIACTTGWLDPREESKNLTWVRAFYRDLFAESGGVPAPGEAYDGAFINHPDTDLADPALNTSGVPWHTLYYKASYPRLQRIKARWDPRDVFRHALSIRVGQEA